MATASDRLANNLNFGALGKATELRQRLLFTLGALIVFRLGTFLPIPGINPFSYFDFCLLAFSQVIKDIKNLITAS